MNSKHTHNPIPSSSTRARCPVCHEAVYSLAGIHPQCAVRQAEPPKLKSKPIEESSVEAQLPVSDELV